MSDPKPSPVARFDDAIDAALYEFGDLDKAVCSVLDAKWIQPLTAPEVIHHCLGIHLKSFTYPVIAAPTSDDVMRGVLTASFRGDTNFRVKDARSYFRSIPEVPVAFRCAGGETTQRPSQAVFADSRTYFVGHFLPYENARAVAWMLDMNRCYLTKCERDLTDLFDDVVAFEKHNNLFQPASDDHRPVVMLANRLRSDGDRQRQAAFTFLRDGDAVVCDTGHVYCVSQGAYNTVVRDLSCNMFPYPCSVSLFFRRENGVIQQDRFTGVQHDEVLCNGCSGSANLSLGSGQILEALTPYLKAAYRRYPQSLATVRQG